jgi:hypothetical protein
VGVRALGRLSGPRPDLSRTRGRAQNLGHDEGPWDSQGFRFEIERIEDLGEALVALSTIRARGETSGADVALKWAHVVIYRSGDQQTRNYGSWDEALEAVGLRE